MGLADTKIGHSVVIQPGQVERTDTGKLYSPVKPMTAKEICAGFHALFLVWPGSGRQGVGIDIGAGPEAFL